MARRRLASGPAAVCLILDASAVKALVRRHDCARRRCRAPERSGPRRPSRPCRAETMPGFRSTRRAGGRVIAAVCDVGGADEGCGACGGRTRTARAGRPRR